MSDEPSPIPDLASIDLAQSFLPAWAKAGVPSEKLSRLVEKHGGETARRDYRDDRRPGRKPQRREGGPRDSARRDDRRDRRPGREDRRPERESRPEPSLAGWEVQFLPDRHGVEGLAKQIKTTARAYPLFDLARLVLEKSERYHVEFKRCSESADALFQLKADGSLWLSERDAVSRALTSQLDKYYRRERVMVDPPKGNFAFVAVCGMSGTLLGPPNFHDYQTKLVRLHAERFANMPFEAFKARIRVERDEALIEKWKEEQSAKDVFFPIDPNEKPAGTAAEEATPAPAAVVGEPPADLVEEVAAELAAEVDNEPEAEVAEPAEWSGMPEVSAIPEDVSTDSPAETTEPVAPPQSAAVRLESVADVENHFREHHLAKAVVRIRERIVAPGPVALNDSAPAVLQLTRGAWEQLNRFPLPLAHRLAQQLTSRGVQIFKAHDATTHAGVARPRHLDPEATPVSDALRAMLIYIESHPSVPRAAQWKALVDLRPVPETDDEDTRETAVAADLFWLLREGHVIDFARRGLEAARKPKPAPRPRPTKAAPAAATVPGPSPAAPVESPVAQPETPEAAEPEAVVEPAMMDPAALQPEQ